MSDRADVLARQIERDPFRMPDRRRAPCDQCGRVRPSDELTVIDRRVLCPDCRPKEADHHA